MLARTMLFIATLLSVAAIQLPADAVESPTLYEPLVRVAGNDGPDTLVRLEVGSKSWRIKKAARLVDSQINGLDIRIGGLCVHDPLANCAAVHVDHYDEPEMLALSSNLFPRWGGLTTYPASHRRDVYLNTYTVRSRYHRKLAAVHELGHILGLAHHSGRGVMSDVQGSKTLTFSSAELAVLQEWYSIPRYRG